MHVLDEATYSLVDTLTEAKTYPVIESELTECGYIVIIVAQRISGLETTMRPGRDKVAWLQDGRVLGVGDYDEMAQLVDIPPLEEQ